MKYLISIILLFFLIIKLHSQDFSYSQSIDNIYNQTIRDFEELFYKELDVSQRDYYNCSDTINKDNCELKRKVFFDSSGRIIADTSFIDTLFSTKNRLFELNKITIVKTHPEPGFLKYHYKTTVDSLLIDSLKRPIKYYEGGRFQKVWEYDEQNRLISFIENPDKELFLKKRTYHYQNDTIIENRFTRNISKFDTAINYLVFDEQKRLIEEISTSKSTTYKSKGYRVWTDSILSSEIYPRKIYVEYEYPSDSIVKIIDNEKSITQIFTLDSNCMVTNQKLIKNDTILLAESKFERDSLQVFVKKFSDTGLYSYEIQYLRQDGKIKCKRVYSMNNKKYDKECYSPEGMILQILSIYDGNITQNLTTIDKK